MLDAVSETPKLTDDDLLAQGEDTRDELIHGAIVPKTFGSFIHQYAEAGTGGWAMRRFSRKPSDRWPGGWVILSEIHVVYARDEVFIHDLAGWRRDRLDPSLTLGNRQPRDWARLRPDWACELLSPGHEARDRVDKFRVLEQSGVPHYWMVDPDRRKLFIYQLGAAGYELHRTATSGEVLRAPPFEAVELRVDVLFGDEDDVD